MKQKLLNLFIILFVPSLISAQGLDLDKNLKKSAADSILGWKKGVVLNLNISQTSLTNWDAGGDNALNVNGLLSSFLYYKKNRFVWNTTLDVGYGLLQRGIGGEYRKTDDKFDFLSKVGYEAFQNCYYTALVNFKTQMAPGYNYPNDTTKIKISDFMAPGYFLGALGLDFQAGSHFSFFVSPATLKITFVYNQTLADSGNFGVKPATFDSEHLLIKSGEKVKTEFGAYIRVIYTKNNFQSELLRNLAFTTKLDLFSNYLKNPQNIDVNWETLLAFKVNKFLAVNLNTQLIYDDDIKIHYDKNNQNKTGPRTQFKEVLGAGLSYIF